MGMWEVVVPKRVKVIWNRCEICGKFISYDDFESGEASHRMVQPDWEYGAETWETLCKEHNKDRSL